MTSTFLGYQFYARDLAKSLQRVAQEPTVTSDKAYYDANIGKVKTVDDLLKNYRLFSYAMKAYGLEDMTYAKGLIRKVLTSDLTDSKSLANQLSDSRYRSIAQAFGFAKDGSLATVAVQSADQQAATVTAFQAATQGLVTTTTANDATTYYKAHIGTVTSVAALEKDQKLYSYVLTAYGLDASMPQASFGALLESFVFAEVLKLMTASDLRLTPHHFRDRDGREVDIVLEHDDGMIAGIEVKASATVKAGDFGGLRALAEACGDRFAFGVVLYDSADVVPFGDRLAAAPLSSLWHGAPRTNKADKLR